MNKKLKTSEEPSGYISISEAAKILDMDPIDLRVLIGKNTHCMHTVSTPNRRLYVLGKDVYRIKGKNSESKL